MQLIIKSGLWLLSTTGLVNGLLTLCLECCVLNDIDKTFQLDTCSAAQRIGACYSCKKGFLLQGISTRAIQLSGLKSITFTPKERPVHSSSNAPHTLDRL